VPEVLHALVHQLRGWGIPVGLTETLDAAEALRCVPDADRERIRHVAAATLVKSREHRAAFELAFDIYFPAAQPGEPRAAEDAMAAAPGGDGQVLRELMLRALAEDDPVMLQSLAAHAVTRYAGIEPGRARGTGVYILRTVRALRLDNAAAEVAANFPDAGGGFPEALAGRLRAAQVAERVKEFRRQLESAVRVRMVADLGPAAVADALKQPLPVDIDLVFAQPSDLKQLQQATQALSRKLERHFRLAERHGRAEPDFRKTMRNSLATGGVPVQLGYRHPPPRRPELIILADVSGSVAQFAHFTLHLMHSLAGHFKKVRSFAFVDAVDEVTGVVAACASPLEAAREIAANGNLIWFDGHSDYGHVLDTFWERWGSAVTSRTTVLVLGDARSNYRNPNAAVLARIGRHARAVHWLNPEPASAWGTGDSAMTDYSPHCASVTECRTVRQLTRFVEEAI
jgi:uncharacterized protein with von Willebrand factor type A (vWA) domain